MRAPPRVPRPTLRVAQRQLVQHRVAACDYDLAVVTNVTHEHLDIHGSLEAYRQAKATLFRHLMAGYRKPGIPKVAVLNADDDSYRYLRSIPADRQLAYSLAGRADVVGQPVRRAPAATYLSVQAPGGVFELRTRLAGDFNLSNILAATTAALALGVAPEAIQEGVWRVRGVVGRMERIDEGQDFAAIVDFAHTPNALQRALEAARTMTAGRVIAVFGCAGERDREKRAWMGGIAARLADVTVMTAEDPRRESLDAILDEMARGAEAAGAGAAVGAGGEEPQPAASTITADAVAIRRCCRFSIVQYLASSPTVHDRPGAGSKNRPLPSLTMIEPT